MTTTVFVDLQSEPEQLSQLVKYLDNLKQIPKENGLHKKVEANLSDSKKYDEILQLVLDEHETLFSKGSERGSKAKFFSSIFLSVVNCYTVRS
jgi:hypothetical protein